MRRTFSIGHSCRTVCSSKAFESPATGTTNRDCPTSAPGASATTQADPAMSAWQSQRVMRRNRQRVESDSFETFPQ